MTDQLAEQSSSRRHSASVLAAEAATRDKGKNRVSKLPQDTGYSKEQYKRDAVLIRLIAMMIRQGTMLHLQGTTRQSNKDMANGICYLMDKTTYDKCMDKARKMVTEQASSTHDSEA